MTYRRNPGTEEWHFCSNCSNWPTEAFTVGLSPVGGADAVGGGYEQLDDAPTDAQLCAECTELQTNGNCVEADANH